MVVNGVASLDVLVNNKILNAGALVKEANAIKNLGNSVAKSQDRMRKGIGKVGTAIKDNMKANSRFRMEFLSTMFFGMQMWRTFSGLFKDMIQAYKDLDSKGNRPLTKSLTRLEASFTFLKFSILDAMGPALSETINRIAKGLQELAESDPEKLAKIGDTIIALATLGGIMWVGSQFELFIRGINKLILTDWALIGTKLIGMKDKILTLVKSPIGKAITLVVSVILAFEAIKMAKNILTDINTSWNDRIKSIGLFTAAGATAGLIFGPKGFIIGATIGFGLGLLINLLDIGFENDFFEKIGNFLKGEGWKNNVELNKKLDVTPFSSWESNVPPGFEQAEYDPERPFRILADSESVKNWVALPAKFDKNLAIIGDTMKTGVKPEFDLWVTDLTDDMSGLILQAEAFNETVSKNETKIIDVYYVFHGGEPDGSDSKEPVIDPAEAQINPPGG